MSKSLRLGTTAYTEEEIEELLANYRKLDSKVVNVRRKMLVRMLSTTLTFYSVLFDTQG